ncbi:aspartate-semialdehyde dehydrogenase [Allobranchiibius sp. GilTou73]|uniref:aspartate-semialdehyde dehydrogenase n=1 Tax=Allobranchiibius sp. GilTou73 TaxID=2904523 RepID=UPI001F44F217|nr:aspartate-semialdehyde dehydrogenase [Allobranchiibius sp. GilTou73]UIJ36477.1 aspartate-semialdehyde dehydrogenase [Allobranchiibius sp. GilTou73]
MTRDGATLAVVGATGLVGQTLLGVLPMGRDVWGEVRLLASSRSSGRTVDAAGRELQVRGLDDHAFDGVDVAVFAAPPEVALEWAPRAVAAGAVVVDSSGAFIDHDNVPLVVPELNPAATKRTGARILASPCATTLTMIGVLTSLHRRWRLQELVVSTYQAVSDAGSIGVQRLYDEANALGGDRSVGQYPGDVRRKLSDLSGASPFPAPIAFNVVPWVGGQGDGESSAQELAVRAELRALLETPTLKIATTCVQVPVTTTHSMTVHATFEQRLHREDVVQALTQDANSVVVLDDPRSEEWPTPVDVVGSDPVFVGRVRQLEDFPRSVQFFVCGDNLRRGSALNLLEIAELVVS